MDPTQTAQLIAQLVATLAALDPEARRAPLAQLYRELQAAGLPEEAAAAIQHQLSRAAEGAATTHTVPLGATTTPAGETTKERQ